MSDIIEDVESDFVVEKIDGKDVKLAVISPYDRAALLREWQTAFKAGRKEARDQKRENLKDAGITGEQFYAEMQSFDDLTNQGVSEQTWIDYVADPMNEHRLLTVSLEVHQPGRGEELARKATTRASMARRAKIAGLQIHTPTVDEAKPDPNPSTLPEMTYGTPEGADSTGPTQNAA